MLSYTTRVISICYKILLSCEHELYTFVAVIQPCSTTSVCLNSGSCSDLRNDPMLTYYCRCPYGYGGQHCEISSNSISSYFLCSPVVDWHFHAKLYVNIAKNILLNYTKKSCNLPLILELTPRFGIKLLSWRKPGPLSFPNLGTHPICLIWHSTSDPLCYFFCQ